MRAMAHDARSRVLPTTISRELRKRFKNPRAVFRRLGFDDAAIERMLRHPKLAYDAGGRDYNGIPVHSEDDEGETVNIELEQAEDAIQERADKVIDHLRRHGLDEESLGEAREMIESELRDRMHRRGSNGRDQDLPRNAIGGGAAGGGPGSGFSGRLSQPDWERASVRDTERGTRQNSGPVLSAAERRAAAEVADRVRAGDKKFAADERKRRAFEERFDLAPISGSLEAGIESPDERFLRQQRAEMRRSPERRIAVDTRRGKSAKNFLDRFPMAARLG